MSLQVVAALWCMHKEAAGLNVSWTDCRTCASAGLAFQYQAGCTSACKPAVHSAVYWEKLMFGAVQHVVIAILPDNL